MSRENEDDLDYGDLGAVAQRARQRFAAATAQPAAEKPNLGLPWTLEGSHPWRIMCETNVPGVRNVVATVAYRPMAELIVRSVNQSAAFDALEKALRRCEADFDVLIVRGDLTEEPRAHETLKIIRAALAQASELKGGTS